MKKITHIAFAALAVAAAADAAATPVFSYTVTSNVVGNAYLANVGLDIAKFNTSLGILQSVEIQFFTDLGTVVKVENLSKKSTSDILATTSGMLTLTSSTVTQTVNYSGNYSKTLKVFDTVNDFNGDSGFSKTLTSSSNSDITYSDAATKAAFSGTGTLHASVTGTSTSKVTGSSGNTRSLVMPVFDAYAKVTYNYVSAVPEPETYAMLLAGLGLMGVVARRRKSA